jgi:hypothetical protein
MKRLRRLFLPHLRFVLMLAVTLLTVSETISRIGWLRPWLLPNRRAIRVHYIGERRQKSLPSWMLMVHFLTTLITWQLLKLGNVSAWFIPFTWAASLSTTSMLWAFVNRKKFYGQNQS